MNINDTFTKLNINSNKTLKSSSKLKSQTKPVNSTSSHNVVNNSKSHKKIVYFKVVPCLSNAWYQLIRRDMFEDHVCGVFASQTDILNACQRYAGENNDFVIVNKEKYFERMPK